MAWLPNNDNHLLRPLPCHETSKTGNQSCHSSHLSPRSKGSPKWGLSESCRRKARYHLLRIRSPSLLCLIRKHRKQTISPITHLISPQGRRALRNRSKAKVVVGRRDTTCYGSDRLLSSALSKISIDRRLVLSLISFLPKVEGRVREHKAKVVVGRRDIACYGEKSFSSPLPCQKKSKIDKQSCRLSHLIPFLRKERSVKGSRGDGDKSERRQRTLFIAYPNSRPFRAIGSKTEAFDL